MGECPPYDVSDEESLAHLNAENARLAREATDKLERAVAQVEQLIGRKPLSDKIEIKGLGEAFARAKAAIAKARQAPESLHAATSALVATCEDLTSQVSKMHDDLKFEASTLGNGGATSTESGTT